MGGTRASGAIRRVAGIVVVAAAALAAPAAARRIDIGGFRLNLRCEGEGSPVVVFDAGAGETLGTWDWVVPDAKKVTRVCAYDRAGLGRSDRGPTPRGSERIVAELRELLVRARVQPPYILVGHSFGGLNVRLYAARHPDEVAGLVLVDATPEDFPVVGEKLLTLVEREKLRTSRAIAPQAFADEVDAMAESTAAVRAAHPKADLPVAILTAAHLGDSEAFRSAWTALQRRLAESFPNGRQIVAARSSHYIQFDEPEVIVDAIRRMVQDARRPPRSQAPLSPGRP